MSDTGDIVSNILDKNSVDLQDNFGQMMLDKIKDVVSDRKMEIAAQFLGSLDDQEIADADTDDMDAEDIEAEADEIGDEEDDVEDQDEGDQDEDA